MKKFAAFDLEIAKVIPQDCKDWWALAPLGITCLCITLSDSRETITYSGVPRIDTNGCIEIVCKLESLVNDGYTIIGFNSAGFDFRVLGIESGLQSRCQALSLNHTDIYFFLFCKLGYAPGLDRLANGLELGNKTAGINGALAPQMWLDGKHEQVLDYCAQDVRLTLDLALKATELGCFHWKTRQEKPVTLDFDRLLTVSESMKLAEPDTSWMGANSWKRSKFTGWMG